MTPEEEQRRGYEAQQLLQNEIYQEAWAKVETRLIDALAQAEVTPERVARLQALLASLRTVRRYVESVAKTGEFAELEQDRRQTLADKVRALVR